MVTPQGMGVVVETQQAMVMVTATPLVMETLPGMEAL